MALSRSPSLIDNYQCPLSASMTLFEDILCLFIEMQVIRIFLQVPIKVPSTKHTPDVLMYMEFHPPANPISHQEGNLKQENSIFCFLSHDQALDSF